MSLYFEKAREFGQTLLDSPKGEQLKKAREIYNNDKESVRKMEEFNAYQININKSRLENVLSQDELNIAHKNLTDLADKLKKEEIIGNLVNSENEFNIFINEIMDVIKATITGTNEVVETSGGCGGCSKNK